MGKERRRAKTKTVLKSVNKMEQLVGMSKSKREKIPIRIPLPHQCFESKVLKKRTKSRK